MIEEDCNENDTSSSTYFSCCSTINSSTTNKDVPSKPGRPTPTDWGANYVDIQWDPPDSDGGDSITRYRIAKYHKGSRKWTKVKQIPADKNSYTVQDLEENEIYVFKVFAVNKNGQSPPSDSSVPVMTKLKIYQNAECMEKSSTVQHISSQNKDTPQIKEHSYDEGNSILPVICVSIHVADTSILNKFNSFKTALQNDEILPETFLNNTEEIDLVHGLTKFKIEVTKCGPNQFFLCMNLSYVEVEYKKLREEDSSALISVNNVNYTVEILQKTDHYVVNIDNRTYVIENKYDPTIIRSPATGKLIKLLANDGEHVFANQSYAEMKINGILTTLTSKEAGVIHFVKHPEDVLEAGIIIAYLESNDALLVNKVQMFTGVFEDTSFPSLLHQKFIHAHQVLKYTLMGYALPEKIFYSKIKKYVETFITSLMDIHLPLFELKEMLKSVSGRIPYIVEKNIKELMKSHLSHISSVLAVFPSQQIANIINSYAETLQGPNCDHFLRSTQDIIKLVKNYENGTRGRMKVLVEELFQQYLSVEAEFQYGHYESIAKLIDKYEDLSTVVEQIFSHLQVKKKNKLVIILMDHICEQAPGLIDELAAVLNKMKLVHEDEVSFRVHHVLIAAHQPPYVVRHNHMEAIFLSAIDMYGHDFCPGNLQKIIQSEMSIFDVLPNFFFHENAAVRSIALEVYIRISYKSFPIAHIEHIAPAFSNGIIYYQFYVSSTDPNSTLHMNIINEEDWDCLDPKEENFRCGMLAAFTTFELFESNLQTLLNLFECHSTKEREEATRSCSDECNVFFNDEILSSYSIAAVFNVLNIVIPPMSLTDDDAIYSNIFNDFCKKNINIFTANRLAQITFIVFRKEQFPKYFTFRARDNFSENITHRHLDPALAQHLELNRLCNFVLDVIPTVKQMHLFLGKAKVMEFEEFKDIRIFIRCIIRHSYVITEDDAFESLQNECEKCLLEAMKELEEAFTHPQVTKNNCNHIFLNCLPKVMIENSKELSNVYNIVKKYLSRLLKLKVSQVEIKMRIKMRSTPTAKYLPLRIFITCEDNHSWDVTTYNEVTDPITGFTKFQTVGSKEGKLHDLLTSTAYMSNSVLELKRFQAQSHGTTYVYDFPDMFNQSLKKLWAEHKKAQPDTNVPEEVLKYTELMLNNNGSLIRRKGLPGTNDIGTVAWNMTFKTPEYPEGRNAFVICNDITHLKGTFAAEEDIFFLRVSEEACKLGIPFLFISATSPSKIGFLDEIKHSFNIAWIDSQNPDKGFKYLYLTPDNYSKVNAMDAIHATLIEDEGESRYKITDVTGKDRIKMYDRFSTSIMDKSSQAYNITISMVTCGAIGIGDLKRIGDRVIQIENSHVILTGDKDLNKLNGRTAYTNFHNGVSHATASDDLQGIHIMLKWLSYMPKVKGEKLPITDCIDPVERDVAFTPTLLSYDTRYLLAGRERPNLPGSWEDGFFDYDSFLEVMKEFAKSVICGRARLGGIPVGVIAVETRTTEIFIPADPAIVDSKDKIICQSGQVWYLDSMQKTAQAINVFNEEGLPLFIFANWRGFSGGIKDMSNQLVKFSTTISKAIKNYNQPIFIYIPPYAELKGGALEMFDVALGKRHVEIYADDHSRVGILKPGYVCTNEYFTDEDILRSIHRVDPECKDILKDILSSDETMNKAILKQREEALLPVYRNAYLSIYDLHDTPVHMKSKGEIQEIIPWAKSRTFLYWRLRRLLLLNHFNTDGLFLSEHDVNSTLHQLFIDVHGADKQYLWDDNKSFSEWLASQINNVKK